ncbi:MAG TPA: GNAT family N-acetyltransferase [Gammaproteobacteria bacterium]
MTEPVTVEHEATRRRFVARVGGAEAVLEYSPVGATTLDLQHTYVPPAFRGRGIASALAAYALDYAAKHGYKIIATCPFVARYVQRSPERRALLAD